MDLLESIIAKYAGITNDYSPLLAELNDAFEIKAILIITDALYLRFKRLQSYVKKIDYIDNCKIFGNGFEYVRNLQIAHPVDCSGGSVKYLTSQLYDDAQNEILLQQLKHVQCVKNCSISIDLMIKYGIQELQQDSIFLPRDEPIVELCKEKGITLYNHNGIGGYGYQSRLVDYDELDNDIIIEPGKRYACHPDDLHILIKQNPERLVIKEINDDTISILANLATLRTLKIYCEISAKDAELLLNNDGIKSLQFSCTERIDPDVINNNKSLHHFELCGYTNHINLIYAMTTRNRNAYRFSRVKCAAPQ